MGKLTDPTGIIEHARFSRPYLVEGYTTDDNARAFQVALRSGKGLAKTRQVSLRFLQSAATAAGFYNDMNVAGEWIDQPGTGEWFGRGMLAISEGLKLGDQGEKKICHQLWGLAEPVITQVTSLRADANLVVAGIKPRVKILLTALEKNRTADWVWFEPGLYYDNGRLPLALFAAGRLREGRQTLDWLRDVTWNQPRGCFDFVGNAGWWEKGKPKAKFDQQPVEAGSMVEASVAAYTATGDKKYLDMAYAAWEWYFGRNIIGVSLVDPKTGGVRDAIHPHGCNLNEGAEAVLSFMLAGMALRGLE